ncbi:hypothetical protein HBB16_03465 [Pseudonocardia sp. MCCB 268]|nr:hypothetical protein [Pseudonocardia cytotoxica]
MSDVLAGAVRETLAEPGRTRQFAVRQLTAVDEELPEATPPGWSLAFLVLADWYDAARTALSGFRRPRRAGAGLDRAEPRGALYATCEAVPSPADRSRERPGNLALRRGARRGLPAHDEVWTVAGLVAEVPRRRRRRGLARTRADEAHEDLTPRHRRNCPVPAA